VSAVTPICYAGLRSEVAAAAAGSAAAAALVLLKLLQMAARQSLLLRAEAAGSMTCLRRFCGARKLALILR
jgi:hypothetical protein